MSVCQLAISLPLYNSWSPWRISKKPDTNVYQTETMCRNKVLDGWGRLSVCPLAISLALWNNCLFAVIWSIDWRSLLMKGKASSLSKQYLVTSIRILINRSRFTHNCFLYLLLTVYTNTIHWVHQLGIWCCQVLVSVFQYTKQFTNCIQYSHALHILLFNIDQYILRCGDLQL